MTTQHHRLRVKVQIELLKEADDSYVATCPQLGCIFVHEATEEATFRAAFEAIEAYLMTSVKHDDPIPDEVLLSHEIKTDKQFLLPSPKTARPPPATLEFTRDLAIAM